MTGPESWWSQTPLPRAGSELWEGRKSQRVKKKIIFAASEKLNGPAGFTGLHPLPQFPPKNDHGFMAQGLLFHLAGLLLVESMEGATAGPARLGQMQGTSCCLLLLGRPVVAPLPFLRSKNGEKGFAGNGQWGQFNPAPLEARSSFALPLLSV